MPDYTLKIRRFDPESGSPAYWEEFGVDLPAERSVLDAILHARDQQDGSLSIRCSCQAAICGSCGVRINGQSRLACNTKLSVAGSAAPAKAYRFVGDARDAPAEDRLLDLAEDPHGIYACTHCFACVEVCPKDVAPMNQIMRLRRKATSDYGIKDQNNGYGHEKAFSDLIEKYGLLSEAQLLPKSYGDGSLIRAQVKPAAVKELVAKLPTVLRGLRSGKVSPKTALIHHKLKDQDQIRRIYKEVESHDDRLELNLYIVGEDGDEGEAPDAGGGQDEGAMAEGGQES